MPATQKNASAQKIMFVPRSAAILVSLMGRKMHELSSLPLSQQQRSARRVCACDRFKSFTHALGAQSGSQQ
jgi:hypothetical protein